MPINRAPYDALVDDDGSNTVGSIWNKQAIKNVLLDTIDAALIQAGRVVQRTVLTGVQHDFGLTYPGVDTMLVCNNSALLTLDGIAGGIDGQQLTIIAGGTGRVDLPHFSGSTVGNRLFNTATSGPTSLVTQGKAIYQYDAQLSVWWLVTHEQGSWIAAPFAASDYTGNGSMLWTVEAGDLFCPLTYRLTGRTLTVTFDLYLTSVGGTPNYALQVRIPAGFTSAAGRQVTAGGCIVSEAGVNVPGSYISVSPSVTLMQLLKPGAAAWTASTNNTRVAGTALFEVA